MELGQRLRQARLEAGLSQRQLCGEEITRNMLSQIENGSARPSMDTLRYFAARLGKPMSYFLEEQAILSPNQHLMDDARQGGDVLALLKDYQSPDPTFDRERWLLEALACMDAARQALTDQKPGYARTLLQQAADAGAQTPYYTPELERRRLLLCYEAGMDARQLVTQLPPLDTELLLRAQAALNDGDPKRCARLLDASETRDPKWYFLRGQAHMALEEYAPAAEYFLRAEESRKVYALLEACYRELEDYKQAYFYACKQREISL